MMVLQPTTEQEIQKKDDDSEDENITYLREKLYDNLLASTLHKLRREKSHESKRIRQNQVELETDPKLKALHEHKLIYNRSLPKDCNFCFEETKGNPGYVCDDSCQTNMCQDCYDTFKSGKPHPEIYDKELVLNKKIWRKPKCNVCGKESSFKKKALYENKEDKYYVCPRCYYKENDIKEIKDSNEQVVLDDKIKVKNLQKIEEHQLDKTDSLDKPCEICTDSDTLEKPGYLCKECDRRLCEKCYNHIMREPNNSLHEHELNYSKSKNDEFYECDICKAPRNSTNGVFICPKTECKFYLCPKCYFCKN